MKKVTTNKYSSLLTELASLIEQGRKTAVRYVNTALVTTYCLILYMNNRFKHLLEDIKRLLSFDEIAYYNMRPPMGNGNFGLSR